MILANLGKKQDTISIITRVKTAGVVAQEVECLAYKCCEGLSSNLLRSRFSSKVMKPFTV
jgi:hypothetical protein